MLLCSLNSAFFSFPLELQTIPATRVFYRVSRDVFPVSFYRSAFVLFFVVFAIYIRCASHRDYFVWGDRWNYHVTSYSNSCR